MTFQHHMCAPLAEPSALSRNGLPCLAQFSIIQTQAAVSNACLVYAKN
jgi:hypothetical protein